MPLTLTCVFLLLASMLILTDAADSSCVTDGNASGVCCNHNVNCNHLLPGGSHVNCTMIFYNGSANQCPHPSDYGDSILSSDNVKLRTYYYRDDGQFIYSEFNVSIQGITTQELFIMFAPRYSTEILHPHCRSFRLNDFVQLSTTPNFFYDCPWSTTDAQGEVYRLHVVNGDEASVRYLFYIPDREKISPTTSWKEWEIFSYIHEDYLDKGLRVTFQPVPARFNKSDYKLDLLGNGELLETRELHVPPGTQDLQTVDFPLYSNTELGVNLSLNEDGAFNSRTPQIKIPENPWFLLLYVVLACVMAVAVFLLILFLYNRHVYKPPPSMQRRVLFLHDENISCKEVISCFAELLEKHCYVLPIYNYSALILNEDPGQWLKRELEECDFVLIFATPKRYVDGCPDSRVYKQLYQEGLNIIRSAVNSATNSSVHKDFEKFATVIFKYNNINEDCSVVHRQVCQINLMRNFPRLLRIIHSDYSRLNLPGRRYPQTPEFMSLMEAIRSVDEYPLSGELQNNKEIVKNYSVNINNVSNLPCFIKNSTNDDNQLTSQKTPPALPPRSEQFGDLPEPSDLIDFDDDKQLILQHSSSPMIDPRLVDMDD